MTGLVRKATLLSVCGLLAATAAFADVPDPAQSTVPIGVKVVGQSNPGSNLGGGFTVDNTPSPAGTFTVIVKDLEGDLLENALVVIDFSAMPDLKLCDTPLDGSTVDCALKTVRKFTDVNGVATFVVLGGSAGAASVLASAAPNITVSASGTLLATIRGAAFDYNGGGGVNSADLSLWLADAAPPAKMRADLDHSGTVGSADLSLWLAGAASQPLSCVPPQGSPCP